MQEYWTEWQKFLVLGFKTAFEIVKRDRDNVAEKAYRKERNTDHSITANIRAFFHAVMRPVRWLLRVSREFWHRIAIELKDFRYWFKDPISISKQELYSWSPSRHTVFKQVAVHTSGCNACGEVEELNSYQCDDCALRYCSACWTGKLRHGVHLMDAHYSQNFQLSKLPSNVSRVACDSVSSRWESSPSFSAQSPQVGIQHAQTATPSASQHIPLLPFHSPYSYHKHLKSDHDETAYGGENQIPEPGATLRPSYRRRSIDTSNPDPSSPPVQPLTHRSYSQRQPSLSPPSSQRSARSRESSVDNKELPAVPYTAAYRIYKPVADDYELT